MCYVQNNSVLLLPGHSGPANSPAAVTRVLSFWLSLETHHLDRQERQMSVHKTHFSCSQRCGGVGVEWKITN